MDGLSDDPTVDFADHPEPLGDGYEASRKNDLPTTPPDHPDQELFACIAALERDDRLRVQDKSVFVERFPDSTDPGERGELALDPFFGRSFLARVTKDDDNADNCRFVDQRRGRIGDRHDGSVLASEDVAG